MSQHLVRLKGKIMDKPSEFITLPHWIYSPDFITAVVEDILDSVWLAAKPYLSEEALDDIRGEVNDYIDNHYDEEWQR